MEEENLRANVDIVLFKIILASGTSIGLNNFAISTISMTQQEAET